MDLDTTVLGPGHSPSSKCSADFVQPVCSNPKRSVISADGFQRCSNVPVWKHLIGGPLTTDERISLIMDLFSDRDEIEALKDLGGGDAQLFINVIDEVPFHSSE